MFKKILTACAGLVLSSTFAVGMDVSGVYSGQGADGSNVSIALRSQDGMVRGQVAVSGGTLPLVGREINGQIQGMYRDASGQDMPFVAVAGPNGLQIQTAAGTLSLARSDSNGQAPAQYAPAPQQQQFAPQQPAAPQQQDGGQMPPVQMEVRRGRVMQAQVPAGWTFSDTTNGVDISAPDGITYISHTWLRGVGRMNCDAYMQQNMRLWPQWGLNNVRILSVRNVNGASKLYELEYTCRNRPAHALVQVSVSPAAESYMAEMVMIQTSPENFNQYKPLMIAIAGSVQAMDANAFCDNGKINNEIQKRYQIRYQTQQDIAAIRNSSYEYRNRVQDAMSLQRSDTNRSQNRFDDPSAGQVTAPLEAQRVFRHADGSYTYSTNGYDPVPSDATEIPAHQYR